MGSKYGSEFPAFDDLVAPAAKGNDCLRGIGSESRTHRDGSYSVRVSLEYADAFHMSEIPYSTGGVLGRCDEIPSTVTLKGSVKRSKANLLKLILRGGNAK